MADTVYIPRLRTEYDETIKANLIKEFGYKNVMAIFALNLIPYITASIVVQVVTTASPRLEALRKEGESGRRKLNQYTRYLAVLFCAVQAYGIAKGLEGSQGVVLNPGLFFELSTVITLVGGTMPVARPSPR